MNASHISKEVKLEIITTLGEFSAHSIVKDLEKFEEDSKDNQVTIRSLVSISRILGDQQNLENRRKSALILCSKISQCNQEEKRLIAIGLKYLNVLDESEIFKTLMMLLKDENQNVKIEADKTLGFLQFSV